MNIPLILFDLIFLPFTLIRLILIYFFGSKYDIQNMEFLDIMLHANNPYFNQESGNTIDVLYEDVRATIKRETKLYIDTCEKEEESLNVKLKTVNAPVIAYDEEKKQIPIRVSTMTSTGEEEQLKTNKNIIIDTKKISTQIKNKHNKRKIVETEESSEELTEESSEELSEESDEIENNTDVSADHQNSDYETSEKSEDSNEELNDNTEKTETQNEYNSEDDQESEQILDLNTDVSHATTEADSVLNHIMNKTTKFNLDVHITKLFNDLEDSVTTMTQSQSNNTETTD